MAFEALEAMTGKAMPGKVEQFVHTKSWLGTSNTFHYPSVMNRLRLLQRVDGNGWVSW